jgi:hypothetical protein
MKLVHIDEQNAFSLTLKNDFSFQIEKQKSLSKVREAENLITVAS